MSDEASILNASVPSPDLKEALANMTEPTHDPITPASTDLPLYSSENLPQHGWRVFRKIVPTRAMRMEGPFRVATSESENEPFLCEDGWLVIDARGYPYAIAREEFNAIYIEIPAAAEHADQVLEWRVRIEKSDLEGRTFEEAERAVDVELARVRGEMVDALHGGQDEQQEPVVEVVDEGEAAAAIAEAQGDEA